jgi:hypothetical protein
MPIACEIGATQLLQHDVGGRCVDASEAAVSHHVRLPPTPFATPLVSLEAQHPQTFVIRVVTALNRRAAVVVIGSLLRLLCRGFVCRAAPAIDGHSSATRLATAALRKHRHDLTTCEDAAIGEKRHVVRGSCSVPAA